MALAAGPSLISRRPVQRLGGKRISPPDRRLALHLQRPVIDAVQLARRQAGTLLGPLQRAVLQLRPDPAHGLDLGAAGSGGIEHAGLVGEPVRGEHAGAGQDMGMMVALVALAVRRMDRHVHGNAVAPDQLPGEVAHDRRPLGRADLRGQRQLPLARGDGVDPGLARLGGVPERRTVLRPDRGTLRGHDERLLDAGLAGVVVHAALALARDARACTVGGSRRRGAPGTAFDRLDGEVEAGQRPTLPQTSSAVAAAEVGAAPVARARAAGTATPGLTATAAGRPASWRGLPRPTQCVQAPGIAPEPISGTLAHAPPPGPPAPGLAGPGPHPAARHEAGQDGGRVLRFAPRKPAAHRQHQADPCAAPGPPPAAPDPPPQRGTGRWRAGTAVRTASRIDRHRPIDPAQRYAVQAAQGLVREGEAASWDGAGGAVLLPNGGRTRLPFRRTAWGTAIQRQTLAWEGSGGRDAAPDPARPAPDGGRCRRGAAPPERPHANGSRTEGERTFA